MAANVALLVLGLLAIVLLIPVNGVLGSGRNAQEATHDPLRASKLYDQYGNYIPTGGMVGGRRGRDDDDDDYPYYLNNYYGYPYGPVIGARYPGGRGGGMLPGSRGGGMFPGSRGGTFPRGRGMFPGVGIGGGGMFPGGRMGPGGMYPGFPRRGQFAIGFSPALCPLARCCSFLPDGSCNFCCPSTVLPPPPRAP